MTKPQDDRDRLSDRATGDAAIDPLERIARAAGEAVGGDDGGVSVFDPDSTFDRVVGAPGAPQFVRRVAEAGRPLQELVHTAGSPQRRVGVPIRIRGKTVGVLHVSGEREDLYSATDEGLLVAIADVVAGLVDPETAGANQRRLSWLEASHSVMIALIGSTDPTETLRMIAERSRVASNASVAGIARPSPDDSSVLVFEVIASAEVDDPESLVGLTVPTKGTASGKAFATGQPVVVRDYGTWVIDEQGDAGMGMTGAVKDFDSAIAVPLTVGDERLGVLTVSRFNDAEPFTDIEVEHVSKFAENAALALGFASAQDARAQMSLLEERERIARDLHDLVIQRLFATGLGLAALSRHVSQPELRARITGFMSDIDRTVLDLRSSIFMLNEATTERASLRAQVWEVTLDAGEPLGAAPRVMFDGPVDTAVPEAMWPDVLAAVRESLSNVVRHASARSVSIEVTVDPQGEQLTLIVADDGVGLAVETHRRSGLANLASRAARWDGTFTAEPVDPHGTILRWRIPLGDRAGADDEEPG